MFLNSKLSFLKNYFDNTKYFNDDRIFYQRNRFTKIFFKTVYLIKVTTIRLLF